MHGVVGQLVRRTTTWRARPIDTQSGTNLPESSAAEPAFSGGSSALGPSGHRSSLPACRRERSWPAGGAPASRSADLVGAQPDRGATRVGDLLASSLRQNLRTRSRTTQQPVGIAGVAQRPRALGGWRRHEVASSGGRRERSRAPPSCRSSAPSRRVARTGRGRPSGLSPAASHLPGGQGYPKRRRRPPLWRTLAVTGLPARAVRESGT